MTSATSRSPGQGGARRKVGLISNVLIDSFDVEEFIQLQSCIKQ